MIGVIRQIVIVGKGELEEPEGLGTGWNERAPVGSIRISTKSGWHP
jgi:hypothetical protein